MRVTVPLLYKEKYLPPRCRNRREAYLRSEHEVEVSEAEPGEAPVALVIKGTGDASHRGQDGEYRVWGGRLWRKCEGRRDLPSLLSVGLLYEWQAKDAAPREAWVEAQPKGTRVPMDGLERAAADAHANAGAVLLLGGEVWEEADEPYLSVHSFGFSESHGLYVRAAARDRSDRHHWEANEWRIDQTDEALASIGKSRGDPKMSVPDVWVPLPEALALRPQEWALERTRERFLEDLASECRHNGFGRFGAEVKRREVAAGLRAALAKVEAGEGL